MSGIASKVTSKLQVTIPKAIAEEYGIRPGSAILWEPAGGIIRVIPPGQRRLTLTVEQRLELFRAARARQRTREADRGGGDLATDRGWTREDLYTRGGAG